MSARLRMGRWLAALTIVFVCVSCDQASKHVAADELPSRGRISMLGDTVRMEYIENDGAFLGLGSQWPAKVRFWILTVGTGVFLSALVWGMLRHAQHRYQTAAMALILGGGLGNLIDRVLREAVC